MRTKSFLSVGLSVIVSAVALALLLTGMIAAAPAADADVTLEKMVEPSDKVVPGSTVTYTIVATNESTNTEAMSVTLTDMLPHGVGSLTWVISEPMTMVDGHYITWTGDITAGGAVTLQFTMMVNKDSALFGNVITNTVEATGTNLVAMGSDSAVLSLVESPICLKKTVVPTMVKPGGMVTYTIKAKDYLGDERTVMFTDTLHKGIEFGGWVSEPEGVTETDGTLTWTSMISTPQEFVFTATLATETALYPSGAVTNTVWAATEGEPVVKDWAIVKADIAVKEDWVIYLPLVVRNFGAAGGR